MIKKRGQEEMIGFALIIIIVAVILLILLTFALGNKSGKNIKDERIDNFLPSLLDSTTDCENNLEFYSVSKLFKACKRNELCLDERKTCDVLNSTINEILDSVWEINENTPEKGYVFNSSIDGKEIVNLKSGNITAYKKGAGQFLSGNLDINFDIYY